MLKTIRVKGDCVESGGERRTLEFYEGFDVLGDDGRALYSLRLLDDGSLEISTSLGMVKHGGKRLDGQLAVRPESKGRVTVSRDEYRE